MSSKSLSGVFVFSWTKEKAWRYFVIFFFFSSKACKDGGLFLFLVDFVQIYSKTDRSCHPVLPETTMKTPLCKLAGWMAEISELDTKATYQDTEGAVFIRRTLCLQGFFGSASS